MFSGMWVSAFEDCLPGRQPLQSFVEAFWSVVCVCCGERIIWSVCFGVAITFSLCVTCQPQPVIAISLLPRTQRYSNTDFRQSKSAPDKQVSDISS